jgi:hypothetical protein
LLFRASSIVLVSGWLLLAMSWLLVRGKLDRQPLKRWLRAKFRRRHRAVITEVTPELGHCHTAPLPGWLESDRDGVSRVVLLEDGKPLPAPSSGHDAIRQQGGGRYSHWGPTLYFSASDNSDPARNGRVYAVEER